MSKITFRPALTTQQAYKLKTWKGTEWFGVEYPYVPYWEANQYHMAYGVYEDGGLNINIGPMFDYICVFLAGEFVCSFEPTIIPTENSILQLKELTLLKDYGR